jgi:putative spermidine/putrescine transport system permease protein
MAVTKRLAVAAVAAVAVVPVALLAVWSFARAWYWPALLPREWSLRAWSYVVSADAGVPAALATSVGVALAVTALALAVALPAGRALGLYEFRGKRLLLFVLLMPVLSPPLASAMGVHALFLRYGLVDTVLGVVLVHLIPAVPYATLVLTASFSAFDTDWEAQARTLGASPLAVLREVTLPAVAPGIAVAAAFAFLISWSQYLLTLLVGGGRVQTLPLALVAFQRSGDDSVAAALALVFLAPPVAAFALVARHFKSYA